MNYRHAFHAGNFADVHKHAVLARVLVRLREKGAPFGVLDTHAGAGLYDLHAEEPNRTGEWRDGIARLWSADLGEPAAALLAPYLEAVRAVNPTGRLTHYPGSPSIICHLLGPADRLVACELEPSAATALGSVLRRDRRAKAVAIDGWTALGAYVPFKERRGLVLIDPPFEQIGEFDRLVRALQDAHKKWATGVYLAWYPIKRQHDADAFARKLATTGIPKVFQSELALARPGEREGLRGSGLVAINPPWRLAEDIAAMMPAIAGVLFQGGVPARLRNVWLTPER